MTPPEALKIIDNTLAQIQTNREGHQVLLNALQVLETLINEVKK
jgi:hypothetical protein